MPIDLAAADYVKQLRRSELRPAEKLAQRIIGAGEAAVGPLLDMACDRELIWRDAFEAFAPLHALRLLGELGSTRIIEPLLAAFPMDTDESYEGSPPEMWDAEVPQIIGRLGAAAVEPLWAYIDDESHPQASRAAAMSALAYASAIAPEMRESIVAGLRERLARSEDKTLAAQLLVALANIGAPDAYADVIALFRAGRIDQEVIAPGTARQLLLSDGTRRLACVKHPLWERYDQHGPAAK